jgi:2-keto-4-pentenoate hydratase
MVDAEKAAALLIAARRDGARIDALPAGAEPATLDDAYAIQDAIIAAIDAPLAGWKVALTNDEAQRRAEADEPAAGPLFAPFIYMSPNVISRDADSVSGFECEFAVRLSADLPAGGAPYDAESVAMAVGSLHPAIEVTGIRLGNRASLGVRGTVADHAGNFSLVCGPEVDNWRGLDLPACTVRHLVDGEEIAASDGANVLGNPLNALAWLANHLAGRGHALKAGHWITTGAATGPLPAPVGSTVTADFADLGTVEVRFQG